MNGDKVFIDSNILIYYISSDAEKKKKAKELILSDFHVCISSQTINEFINVCIKKKLIEITETINISKEFMNSLSFQIIDSKTIEKALEIHVKKKFSYWDSLIIASALISDCKILYSEDMHNGLVVDGKLKIVNPFLEI